MFKANSKDSRTMPMTSFWYVVIVKLEHIAHLLIAFTVKFEQLDAYWN